MLKTKNTIQIVVEPIKGTVFNAHLYGEIIRPVWGRNYDSLSVEYVYYYHNENGDQIVVKEGVNTLVKDQIDALAGSIDHALPSKCDSEKKLHYEAFRILMSQNYEIPLNNIEIID